MSFLIQKPTDFATTSYSGYLETMDGMAVEDESSAAPRRKTKHDFTVSHSGHAAAPLLRENSPRLTLHGPETVEKIRKHLADMQLASASNGDTTSETETFLRQSFKDFFDGMTENAETILVGSADREKETLNEAAGTVREKLKTFLTHQAWLIHPRSIPSHGILAQDAWYQTDYRGTAGASMEGRGFIDVVAPRDVFGRFINFLFQNAGNERDREDYHQAFSNIMWDSDSRVDFRELDDFSWRVRYARLDRVVTPEGKVFCLFRFTPGDHQDLRPLLAAFLEKQTP